jgi:hypothetical protein
VRDRGAVHTPIDRALAILVSFRARKGGFRPRDGADRISAIGTNPAREHSFEVSTRARVARVWIILASGDVASGDGGAVSTVIENLLSRKQKLVEQLEKAPSVEDRDRIEHQLEQINTALDFLDRPEAKEER